MPKNLVKCGNCELLGTNSILGELTGEGNFAILRFHNGYTTIKGNDFAVICGNCGEETYIRKEGDERNRNQWQSWVLRINSWSQAGTI